MKQKRDHQDESQEQLFYNSSLVLKLLQLASSLKIFDLMKSSNSSPSISNNWTDRNGLQHPYPSPQTFSVTGANSRALQAAKNRKARMVIFYKNGEAFSKPVRLSLVVGKTFKNFDSLCDYLTEKTQVPLGVRYIFTVDGDRVDYIDQLQHGQTYVVSGVSKFHPLPYGQDAQREPFVDEKSFIPGVSREDLKLLKPPSPAIKFSILEGLESRLRGAPSSYKNGFGPEGKIVTIINKRNPVLRSRVLLNLRNPGTFETVLRDLGEAVQLPNPRMIYTQKGNQVRSISQLKRELAGAEIFFLDGIEARIKTLEKTTSQSLQEIGSKKLKKVVNKKSSPKKGKVNGDSMQLDTSSSTNETSGPPSEPRKRVDSAPDDLISLNRFQSGQLPSSSPLDMDSLALDFAADGRRTVSSRRDHQPKQLQKLNVKAANSIETEPAVVNDSKETKNEMQKTPKPPDAPDVPEVNNNGTNTHDNNTSYDEGISLDGEPPAEISYHDVDGGQKYVQQEIRSPPLPLDKVVTPENVERNLQDTYRIFDSGGGRADSLDQPKPPSQRAPSIPKAPSKPLPTLSRKTSRASSVKSSRASSMQSFSALNGMNDTNFIDGLNVPDANIHLERILGFTGDFEGNNLQKGTPTELAYCVSGVIILWDPVKDTQRFYTEHKKDIDYLTVYKEREVASAEKESVDSRVTGVKIYIWKSSDLETITSFTETLEDEKFLGLCFSNNGSLLVLKATEILVTGRLWDYKKNGKNVFTLLTHKLSGNEVIYGAMFHPHDEEVFVTWGQNHLTVWQRGSDLKTIVNHNELRSIRAKGSINCVVFLPDDTLLTGDSEGKLVIWAPVMGSDDHLDFMQRLFKGHEAPISRIKVLGEDKIVSGDFNGAINTWSLEGGHFQLINSIRLPSTTGAIIHFCCAKLPECPNDIFVGTSSDQVMRGNALDSTEFDVIIDDNRIQGNILGFLNLVPHPSEGTSFFTTSVNDQLCKWTTQGIKWKVQLPSQGMTIDIHPKGKIVAVGLVTGEIAVVTSDDGIQVSVLPVAETYVACISYSPEGDILAAGCGDGIMYLLPVADDGLSYQSISVLRGPGSFLSFFWSLDGQYILSNVEENGLQELVLWDLPSCRYMRGITKAPENISWKDQNGFQTEGLLGIWENQHYQGTLNIVCSTSLDKKYAVTGDDRGSIRLFSYPCSDPASGFRFRSQGSSAVNDIKFLTDSIHVVSANNQGILFVWKVS